MHILPYSKLIRRNLILSLLLAASLMIPFGLIVLGYQQTFPEFRVSVHIQGLFFQTTRIILLANILFAYEFCIKADRFRMTEMMQSIKKGVEKHYSAVLFWLLSIAFVQFIFFTGLQILFGWREYLSYPTAARYFIQSNLIYFLFLPILGLSLGLLLSFTRQRLTSYLVIFLVIALTLTQTISALNGMPIFKGIASLDLFNLLWIFPQDIFRPYIYGFPAERVVLYRLLLWIAIILFLVVLRIRHNIQKTKAAGLTIFLLGVIAVSAYLTLRPSSAVFHDNGLSLRSMSHDQLYYASYKGTEEPATFAITNYSMAFQVNHKLNAQVTLEYSADTSNQKMGFTLYHGYKVAQIKDRENRAVDFKQEGDYIDILSPVPQEGSLTFYYSGFGDRFYSNEQGVFLPGYLPYYPHAGKYKVYSMEYFMMMPQQTEPVRFTVEVKGIEDLKTNLDEVSPGVYQGVTETVSLLSGMYQTTEVSGVQLDRPILEPYDYEKTLENSLRHDPSLISAKKLTHVTVMPIANNFGVYELVHLSGTHMLTTSLETYDKYKQYLGIQPLKYGVMQIQDNFDDVMDHYEKWRALDVSYLRAHPEELAQHDLMEEDLVGVESRSYYVIAKALNHASPETIKAYLNDYIHNTADLRTEEQFFNDLKEAFHD